MDKKKYWFVITAAALSLSACTEKDVDNFVPVKEGSEITFGAVLDTDNAQTRTYYGDEVEIGTSTNKFVWPIYWNYLTKDEIYVYSPQAVGGRNQQVYRVEATGANMTSAANITRIGEYGIQASAETSYDFYGIYPASARTGEMTGGATAPTMHAKLPYRQNVVFAGTKNEHTNTIPDEPATGEIAYLTTPDMNNCLMITTETGVTPQEDKPVSLQFKPFSTVIDITIPGPVDNNTLNQNRALITSVQIDADAPIAGSFSYNFKDHTFEFGEDKSNSIFISTMGNDKDGNLVGIPLQNNNTLNLQAFMIPNPDVKNITVTVNTSGFQEWKKNLTLGNNGEFLAESKINKVKLPPLRFAEAAFDYSVWLSQMDPRIYISELSLPGSCLSFNTAKNNVSGNNVTQDLDIAEQFQAGVRVFQAHTWIVNEKSDLDGGDTRLNLIAASNGSASNTGIGLYEILQTLQKEMEENHGNEFCVLLLSDYSVNNHSFAEFYARFKDLTDELERVGLLANNVSPSTTIGDVKGKVILKFALNGQISDYQIGDLTVVARTNRTLQGFTTWSDLNGSKSLFNWHTEAAQSALAYAPLQFGNVGAITFTAGSGATNLTFRRPEITAYDPGLVYEAAQKLIATCSTSSPGNIDCTSKPSDAALTNASNMWYIYSEQANPNNAVITTNVQNVVNALSLYDLGGTNRFYMTYCGGTGGSDITEAGNKAWSDAIANVTNKPYGWVLFNKVTKQATAPATNTATANNIQKVISNNNDAVFKLKRNTTKTSPNGDVGGSAFGGKLF